MIITKARQQGTFWGYGLKKHHLAYMKLEPPSLLCCSFDSLQIASPPAKRRTCNLSEGPIPPHAEYTMMGPNLY